MKKSFIYWTVVVFPTLLIISTTGGCTPSSSSDTTTGANATAVKGAVRTPPPNANIGTAVEMNKAAQESAARFSKQK